MTTSFAIYDLVSGKILRTGTASVATANIQAMAGEGVLLETANHDLQYVSNGLLVDKPVKPSEFHEFDYRTRQWVANPELAWASVKQRRDALLVATDWRVLRASDTGVPMDPAWTSYRRALRDITVHPDPFNITWPMQPKL